MSDPRIEAAVDAVIKARGWRDCHWGDGAIGGFDYSTDNKKRHVIRDHEAEACEGKTVILFETDDYEEYEREYRRACIRREISAAIAAADKAAWRPIVTAPRDGTLILVAVKHIGCDVVSWWGAGWRETTNGLALRDDPTHWQPLPAPPKTEAPK